MKLLPFAFTSKSVKSTVGDTEVDFYPMSSLMCLQLRQFAPLAASLSYLFGSQKGQQGFKTKRTSDKASGYDVEETEAVPVSEGMLDKRESMRARALEQTLQNLLTEENLVLLGKILLDALTTPRDRVKGGVPDSEAHDFVAGLDLGNLAELFAGVIKVNGQKILRPLGLKEEVLAKVNLLLHSTMGTPAGSDSKTDSSAPSVSDSTSTTS